MPLEEPEAGPTWAERAVLPRFAGVLDAADLDGAKNDLIDRVQKAALRRAMGTVASKSILDIGCGNGRMAAWLVERGAQVTGVDPSEAMADAARRNAPGARLVVGDAEKLPFDDDSFDAALTVAVLQYLAPHPERLAGAAAEIARVLKPGGRFFALENIHDGDLLRGASRAEYESAFRRADFEVRASRPIRVGDSTVMMRALGRPRLARLPFIPMLMRAEAKRKTGLLKGGRYADQLIVCVRR